eukprot:CAMPEP_0177669034 /NCGR_PEP_ID=MMETSP0447-20121125/23174_1 /TAXON_ID=0 /ORGANISM="Stygamoeba regulata, Strain BSH-02190019" /LENGTH=215 /DNA_ID=CAMNT_0019175771 /DNA_START=211 /DNA_END=853 /DNA_ORIENTATION=-
MCCEPKTITAKSGEFAALERKAYFRNPDEFYFGMVNSKTEDGIHKTKADQKKHSAAAMKEMNRQDIGYLSLKRQVDAKKVERIQQDMAFTEAAAHDSKRKHTVFVESYKEAKEFDEEEFFDTPAKLLGRVSNRPRHADLAQKPVLHGPQPTKGQLKKAQRARELKYKEVAAREKRRVRLAKAAAELEKKDRLSHARGARQRIVKNDGTVVHKWKR